LERQQQVCPSLGHPLLAQVQPSLALVLAQPLQEQILDNVVVCIVSHYQVRALVQSIHHSMSVLQSCVIPEFANIKLYLNPSQLELSE
jgi:hypothetical protein